MFVLRNVRTSVVQFRLHSREAVLLHLFYHCLKSLSIDNSVTDRYSVIGDLCGYAERFVFDLLRKAYIFFWGGGGGGGFRCYIYFICRCLNDSDSPAQFVKSPIARRGICMKIYIHYTQAILHPKSSF